MRWTIARKLSLGFMALIISMAIVFVLTKRTLDQNEEVLNEITLLRNPSLAEIQDLNREIIQIQTLTKRWGVVQSDADTEDKKLLIDIIKHHLPLTCYRLDSISQKWKDEEDKQILDNVFGKIRRLNKISLEVTKLLPDFSSYSDPSSLMTVEFMLGEGGEFDHLMTEILFELEFIFKIHREYSENANNVMVESFHKLNQVVIAVGIPLALLGVLIAILSVRTFIKPILKLKDTLLMMAKGIMPEQEGFENRDDEIGEIAQALTQHRKGLIKKIEFATQLGKGNFDQVYVPASQLDELGNELVNMRDSLFEFTNNLEQKVLERTHVINEQKETIEEKNKSIYDSINYALNIQQALLPREDRISALLDEFFILFEPRDIVSGDFYWFYDFDKPEEGRFMFAAVDCTGHGIPGAFMSMIGYSLLNRIVKEGVSEPEEVLQKLHVYTQEALKQHHNNNNDGMDLVLYHIDLNKKELKFSGAKNPLVYIQNGELFKVRGSKFPIGGAQQKSDITFEQHIVNFDVPTSFYMFTDGYQDQFGGVEGKKFFTKPFLEKLKAVSSLSTEEQKNELRKTLKGWQGEYDQVDDILVVGMNLK